MALQLKYNKFEPVGNPFAYPWVRGSKMFICLFFNVIYKQIIPDFIVASVFLSSCSLSSIQIMAKHGLSLLSGKARLSSFAVVLLFHIGHVLP